MLDAMFHPRSVAIIGASKGVTATGTVKTGTAALMYLIRHHFPGKIYPINPKEKELMGFKCYPRISDVPDNVDLAGIVVPSAASVQVMEECVQKGVKTAVIFTSGFAEAGNQKLQDELLAAARAGNIRFCGPNTAGMINVGGDLAVSISMSCEIESFKQGEIAFITQSGALGGSMLSRAMDEGVGFSYWISSGNEADLDTADYIDYLVDEDNVRVFTLFTEGIRSGQKFLNACRKAARARKPIAIYKTGLSEVGAAAAKSHTGALAGSDQVFDKICKQYGLIRVDDVAELFHVALALNWLSDKLPRGNRMGIISGSGGIGGVGADECYRFGLEVPELTQECKDVISKYIPPFGAIRNPVDTTGQIRAFTEGYQETVRCILNQDYIDGLLLLVTMASEPRAEFYGREISKIARESSKPVIVAWTGALSLAPVGYPLLSQNRVPNFLSVHSAVKAMRALVDYRNFLDRFESSG